MRIVLILFLLFWIAITFIVEGKLSPITRVRRNVHIVVLGKGDYHYPYTKSSYPWPIQNLQGIHRQNYIIGSPIVNNEYIRPHQAKSGKGYSYPRPSHPWLGYLPPSNNTYIPPTTTQAMTTTTEEIPTTTPDSGEGGLLPGEDATTTAVTTTVATTTTTAITPAAVYLPPNKFTKTEETILPSGYLPIPKTEDLLFPLEIQTKNSPEFGNSSAGYFSGLPFHANSFQSSIGYFPITGMPEPASYSNVAAFRNNEWNWPSSNKNARRQAKRARKQRSKSLRRRHRRKLRKQRKQMRRQMAGAGSNFLLPAHEDGQSYNRWYPHEENLMETYPENPDYTSEYSPIYWASSARNYNNDYGGVQSDSEFVEY